jgi:AcrR family transcriptional regulator
LYTYVPNKKELVDLMYDSVLGELPSSYELDGGWRAALSAWSEDLRAFYVRHPWTLSFSQARPVLGPNEFAVRETLARILRETGLPASRLRSVFALLFHYVRGAAQTVAEARQAPAETGLSDEEWWLARTTLLREVVPDLGDRFPAATWLESDDGDSDALGPDDADLPYLERRARQTFEAGLAVILDGLEATIARRRV